VKHFSACSVGGGIYDMERDWAIPFLAWQLGVGELTDWDFHGFG